MSVIYGVVSIAQWHCNIANYGLIPVILLFTKFDALDARAFKALTPEEKKRQDAHALAQQRSEERFRENELQRFSGFRYPPKDIIYLRSTLSLGLGGTILLTSIDMDDEEESHQCSKIIEITTANLHEQTLKHLLISVQKVNIKLWAKYAIE